MLLVGGWLSHDSNCDSPKLRNKQNTLRPVAGKPWLTSLVMLTPSSLAPEQAEADKAWQTESRKADNVASQSDDAHQARCLLHLDHLPILPSIASICLLFLTPQ